MRLIDELHTERPYYSSRCITKTLNQVGYKVNRKRIQSYMLEMGIVVFYPGLN